MVQLMTINIPKMDIKNKILGLTLAFCYTPFILIAQEKIKCECDSIDLKFRDNLYTVVDKNINEFSSKNEIILVDYMSNDSIDIFRLNGSIFSFELFYKKPDCFFLHRDNIVYLFTENYANKKDTIWLNTVLLETLKFFRGSGTTAFFFRSSKATIIDWSKDSIISLPYYYIELLYDPIIMEYKMYKGEIIEEKDCNEMLYPDTGEPKGILDLRKNYDYK